MIKFVVGFSIGAVFSMTLLYPFSVERIGVLAAISVCSKNDGIKSITPFAGSRYTVVCRNTATFNKMTAEIIGEEEDDITMVRKE